jgi:hypothetical protein
MSDGMELNDEVRLSDDVVFDEYFNSVGEKVVTARRDRDVLMTAKMLAKLYGVDVSTVRKQLKDIFADKTLDKKAVSEIIAHKADDGKLYETRYYDESVIVELARRLRSEEAKALREWLDGKN